MGGPKKSGKRIGKVADRMADDGDASMHVSHSESDGEIRVDERSSADGAIKEYGSKRADRNTHRQSGASPSDSTGAFPKKTIGNHGSLMKHHSLDALLDDTNEIALSDRIDVLSTRLDRMIHLHQNYESLLGAFKKDSDAKQSSIESRLIKIGSDVNRWSLLAIVALVIACALIIITSIPYRQFDTTQRTIKTTPNATTPTTATNATTTLTDPTSDPDHVILPSNSKNATHCTHEMNFYLHNHTQLYPTTLKDQLPELFLHAIDLHPALSSWRKDGCISVQWKSKNEKEDPNGFAVFAVIDYNRGYILNRDSSSAWKLKDNLQVQNVLAMALRYVPGMEIPKDYYNKPEWSNQGYAEVLFNEKGLLDRADGVSRNNGQLAQLIEDAYRNYLSEARNKPNVG